MLHERSLITLQKQSHGGFYKRGVLKIVAKFTHKQSGTSIFLWILWNFQETIVYRIFANGCFWLQKSHCRPDAFIIWISARSNEFQTKNVSLGKNGDLHLEHWNLCKTSHGSYVFDVSLSYLINYKNIWQAMINSLNTKIAII